MSNAKSKIHLLTTGGTIEKTYDEEEGTLFNRETVIRNRINSKLRLPYTDIEVHSLMAMDSLDMKQSDRALICNKIKELALNDGVPIVVLHGTDTMQQSAELVQDELKGINVPVIFTGAMRPLGFDDTDALQNVTEALFAAKLVGPGVYISFHNHLFPVPGARKNKDKRTFEIY